MIYLVYGEEEYLLDNFINNEIKKKKIDTINKYEYPKNTIIEILEDASYLSMFSSKKAIIVENSEFINKKDDNEEELINYINNPNEDTYLFIKLLTSKLDERKKLVTLLNEKATVKSFPKSKDIDANKFIKDYLKNNDLTIDTKLISEIINRVGNDYYMLSNELDKLILYKEDNIITKEDIDKVISISLEDDVFKLINEMTNRNLNKILKIYNDLINMGNHPSLILMLIANQIRLIYQVKVLSRDMLSDSVIATKLGVHPYQVKLASNKATLFSEQELLNLLYKLSLIDEDIKLGRVDINNSLEPFFIELCK